MLASITHILPVTLIRRERLLPVPGKVLVRKGQKVSATDTLATANLFSQHVLLNIRRGLGVSVEVADQVIQCKPGVQVADGDVLAGPVGLTKRVIRSPYNGQVVLVGNGQIWLEVSDEPFKLRAGLPGEVVELVPERGAIVQTTGALIQGVWGNGAVGNGLMYALKNLSEQVVTPDQLDVSFRGAIVLGGYCNDVEVLNAAAELPLRGLILTSMAVSLIPLADRMTIPILIIEGFGKRKLNSAAFKLLSTSEGREIALNAEPWDRYGGTRPEIVIPLPGSENLLAPREADVINVGQQVRLLRAPEVGAIGTIENLIGLASFPSGLRAEAAQVKLEGGKTSLVPLMNLEVLE